MGVVVKKLFLISLGVFLGTVAWAQVEGLTSDQTKEFRKQALTIDQPNIIVFSGPVVPDTSLFWTARQGFSQISEQRFYELTNHPDIAAQARSYKSLGWGLTVAGGAASVGGMIWMFSSVSSTSNISSGNYNGILYGTILTCAGLVPLWLGIDNLRHNLTPVQQAKEVADEFNDQLAKSLKGGSSTALPGPVIGS
jgi:hypothetical protein